MREKHGIKNPRIKDEQKTILPAGNPANPSLTNEQRLKLKANREDVLRTINKRLEASGD